jgi:hypothetical protein
MIPAKPQPEVFGELKTNKQNKTKQNKQNKQNKTTH